MDPNDLDRLKRANKHSTEAELQKLFASLKARYLDQDILEAVCRNQLRACAQYLWEHSRTLCPKWTELAGIFLNELIRCEGHPMTPYIACLGNNIEALRSFLQYNRASTLNNPWIAKGLIGALNYGYLELAQEMGETLFNQI